MVNKLQRNRAGDAALHAGRRGNHRTLVSLCAALAALLAGGCDGTSGAPAAGSPVAAVTRDAALAGPGSSAHDLYAARGFTCDACHPCGKKSADGHAVPWMQTADLGFHAYSANRGLGECQLCHGPTLDGLGGTTSVSCAQCHGAGWKTDCTMCHGGTDGPSGAPPATTWGNGADAVRVGAHTSHLAATHGIGKAVSCATCHPIPADALSPGHVDGGNAEVVFAGLPGVPAGPPAFERPSATCANVYCHGATLAGGAAPAPIWTATDGSQRACGACHGAPPPEPHPASTACGECHAGYGPASVNAELHIDGKLDATLTCSSCHGSAASPAPPRGTHLEVATTTRAVGAHQAHLAGGTLAAPVACTECHAVPAAMAHSTGAVELAWGPRATARAATAGFDAAALTCSNYCHGGSVGHGGSNKTPSWTTVDGTQDACGTCHGAPPPAPHTANPDCGLCHAGYTLTSVDVATHVDGKRDVKDLTCTSCHGSAQNAAPPLGTLGETEASSPAVGAHQQHLVAGTLRGPVACEECHAVPVAMDHADGTVQLAFGSLARTDGAPATFDEASLTCSELLPRRDPARRRDEPHAALDGRAVAGDLRQLPPDAAAGAAPAHGHLRQLPPRLCARHREPDDAHERRRRGGQPHLRLLPRRHEPRARDAGRPARHRRAALRLARRDATPPRAPSASTRRTSPAATASRCRTSAATATRSRRRAPSTTRTARRRRPSAASPRWTGRPRSFDGHGHLREHLLPRRDAEPRRHRPLPELDEPHAGHLHDVPRRAASRAAPAGLRLHPLPPGLHRHDRPQVDARERHQRLPDRLQQLPRHAAEHRRALRAPARGHLLQQVPRGLHGHHREPDAAPERTPGRDALRLERLPPHLQQHQLPRERVLGPHRRGRPRRAATSATACRPARASTTSTPSTRAAAATAPASRPRPRTRRCT